MKQHSTRFLRLTGYFSIFFGLFHLPFAFLGEGAAKFFSAPPPVLAMIRSHSPWLYLVLAVILGLFSLFGAYCLSAAGLLCPALRYKRAMLWFIASLYTLRGLVLLPQVLTLVRHPSALPLQTPVFSALSLMVGLCAWQGLREYGKLAPRHA